eukprot:3262514-Amphidinium_carterae.1
MGADNTSNKALLIRVLMKIRETSNGNCNGNYFLKCFVSARNGVWFNGIARGSFRIFNHLPSFAWICVIALSKGSSHIAQEQNSDT